MDLPLLDDYLQLFLQDTPLLDVRAPVEFSQGSFPLASNVPLMNDEERQQVGIRYKEMDQEQAIQLGHQLVSGDTRAQRVAAWQHFVEQHPQGVLYCFRGGLRSRISQQWIYEHTGIHYPRVKGGYKALRRFLLDELEKSAAQMQPLILTGRTGTGKTLLLQKVADKVDLEEIFKHRGSAFGKRLTPQPSQIDIENELSIALLKLRSQDKTTVLLEDEARNIGSRKMPEEINAAMGHAPLLVLQRDLEERVDIVFDDYVSNALAEHQSLLGEEIGFRQWSENLLQSLDRIQRRLGGARHKEVRQIMSEAIARHFKDASHHKVWIARLLCDYYDPMYDYQLSRKAERIVFRGDEQSILEYLRNSTPIEMQSAS